MHLLTKYEIDQISGAITLEEAFTVFKSTLTTLPLTLWNLITHPFMLFKTGSGTVNTTCNCSNTASVSTSNVTLQF